MEHIVIIGNGVAGITAARNIRKGSDFRITIISAETDYFFSRTALMYVFMGQIKIEHTEPYERGFWKKNKIDLVNKQVSEVDFVSKVLSFSGGGTMSYDKLILATGSVPRGGDMLDSKAGIQGLYSYQDLTSMEEAVQGIEAAVVVGGGLIGIEMAEMLRSRNIDVTLLVREKKYWASVLPPEESEIVEQQIKKHGVSLILEDELGDIKKSSEGKVEAVRTKKGTEIPCGFLGLAIGVEPNIHFLKDSPLNIGRGILVNEYMETNIQGVYAIGDCVELASPAPFRKSMEQVWYTAKAMGEVAAQNIIGKSTKYDQGIWFNSAKFFDVEYQTYGHVEASFSDSVASLVWRNQELDKLIRINYSIVSMEVLGFNLMGIRYRHKVCENWIKNKAKLEFVVEHLHEANFDPEFSKRYEPELKELLHKAKGNNV